MVLLEAPGREGRALLLLPPIGFDPDPRFAAALLDGLARAVWLDPKGPTAVVAGARTPRERGVLVEVEAPALPPRLREALTSTASSIALLEGALDPTAPGGDARTVVLAERSLAQLGDELLRAASHAYDDDPSGAVAHLEELRATVDAGFGTVALALTDLTLTDRDGTLPLSLTHVGELPLRLRVEVTAPAALTWPDGATRTLSVAAEEVVSLAVPIRSGSTGTFPVTVTVTDPTGTRVLVTGTVSVRATAVARPALAVISMTVLALTIAGLVRQHRRGMRDARAGRP